jgi:chromosome segregation ATPase
MAKNIKPEDPIVDISASLEQLGETTTAAELVRTKGQSKKVRIISEKKLMDWILALLNQHLAGKADAFSDKEKEELLKKTQDELARRIKREQQAEAERDRIKSDLDRAMGTLTNTKATQEELDQAMAALKAKLEEAEHINQDLQQDNYDLHDQLNEKMAMVSTTIAEKERLKETVKYQMLRSNALVEGVLGLDSQLYGGRHQEETPVDEGANEEHQFYHDFEVGAKVVDTLSNDLQRLRGLAQGAEERADQQAHDPRLNLLESDLKMIEELKQGSLHAIDVAQPVAGLVEAMEGVRSEAMLLEQAGNTALGVAAGREETIAAVPDSEGEAPEVIAGTTGVVREVAAALARARQRMIALREMADQADEARNTAEEDLSTAQAAQATMLAAVAQRAATDKLKAPPELGNDKAAAADRAAAAVQVIGQLRGDRSELEQLQAAHAGVLKAISSRAEADKVAVPEALGNERASTAERSAAAVAVVDQLRGGADTVRALDQQLELMNRLLGEEAGVRMAPLGKDPSHELLIERVRENSEALERLLREKKAELAAALKREQALAEQLRVLAKARASTITPDFGDDHPLEVTLKKLDAAIAGRAAGDDLAVATKDVLAALQVEAAKAPSGSDLKRLDEERSRLASQIGQAQGRIAALEREIIQVRGEHGAAQAHQEARRRFDRDIASELVAAAHGDDLLAEASADLALALENNGSSSNQASEDLWPQVKQTLTMLSRRKHDLAEQKVRLEQELASARSAAQEATARSSGLGAEKDKLSKSLAQIQQSSQDLERDLARAKTDIEAMRNQVAENSLRRTATEGERNKLASQLGAAEERSRDLEAQLGIARQELEAVRAKSRAQGEADRLVASELVRAAQGDSELAHATADLALSLEDTSSSAQPVDSGMVSSQVSDAVAMLAKRKLALSNELDQARRDSDALRWQLKEANDRAIAFEGERDEMAASGKEVINLLTQQRERSHQELDSVRAAHEEAQGRLARFEHRVSAAESANRQLAEALSMLAAQEKDQAGVEDKRVDLELALSQLPDEGEEEVSIPEDLSLQLAASGKKLAEALLSRRQAMTTTFAKAQREQDNLKSQVERMKGEITAAQSALEEHESQLRSSQAEVKALRGELTSQGRDLAAKVQELTTARGDMASIRAELAVTAGRIEDQERRLQANAQSLGEARREHERLQSELQESQLRADGSAQAQNQLVGALRSLTNRHDASPALAKALTESDSSDPLSKASQKLDMAQAAGPEQLAIAGQAYVQALRDRVHHLVVSHEGLKAEHASGQAAIRDLHNEAAATRASVVDRDHQIENLTAVIDKAKQEQSELMTQLIDQRRAHDAIAASLKQFQEQLRLTQAELADYQARDGATSGHYSSDNDRLRAEVDRERQLREKIEAEYSELHEQVGSIEARLRAQRDEFTRRLTERDGVIQQKDRQLDALSAQRSDAKSLEAQVGALSKELNGANDRIKELEAAYGVHAGVASKSGDLARELKNLQAERDSLREKHRQTESDHTDAVSLAAQLTTQLDEKRKELAATREKFSKELGEERDRAQAMRDEFRKLKEEVVGLRARIRRLTDPGTASGGFSTVKDPEADKGKDKDEGPGPSKGKGKGKGK